jgi:hypothetical protein
MMPRARSIRGAPFSFSLLSFLLLSGIAVGAGCKVERQAHIAGVWVAQADGLSKAGKGETIAITRGLEIKSLPASENVRLAIARDVEWSQVRALRKRILEAGKTPFLMVASDRKTGAIELYEKLEGDKSTAIDVFVSVGGKLCVAPPGINKEAKCVKHPVNTHVDRSYTRELVREAHKAWGLSDVIIEVPPDIEWAEVVRAVDGARTCCYEDKMRVRLK